MIFRCDLKLFSLGARTMDVSVGVPIHPAKEKPPINVVGDVGGRIAIMVVSIYVISDPLLYYTHCSLNSSRMI